MIRRVTDDERRARLGVRHRLVASAYGDSPEAVVSAMTALHATETASVYLSCWARSATLNVSDVNRAIYDDRSLIKQLAMRRALFVFPRDLLPVVWPSVSARVAATERTRISNEITRAGVAKDGAAWLDHARAQVLDVLADAPDGLSALAVRRRAPLVDITVAVSPTETWSAPRILTHLGATADIVRGASETRFPWARPNWTLTANWLDTVPPIIDPASGYNELVRRWLVTFGPGTVEDIVWWLGATKTIVRAALLDVGAVEVALDHGAMGWLLPEDLDEVPDPGPWVSLLPVLDPTVMGWKHRGFFLGPHKQELFDSRGNAGTTVWVDGRIVGCWVQDATGAVHIRLLTPVPAHARRALDEERLRLTDWLAGAVINSGYRSPAMLTR